MKRYLLFLCAAAVLVSGCVKDGEEESAARESSGRAVEEASPEEGRLLLEMEKTGPEEKDEAAVLTRLESGQRALLALPGGEAIIPQDTEIGTLQSNAPYAEPGIGRVYSIITGFLKGLTEGRVEDKIIEEEWRWLVKSSLEDPIGEGAIPKRYRVGEILIEGGTARANVRLLSDRGRSSGEIYLLQSGPEGGWKITDFQADLYELLEDYNVNGRFEPKMYDMTDLF